MFLCCLCHLNSAWLAMLVRTALGNVCWYIPSVFFSDTASGSTDSCAAFSFSTVLNDSGNATTTTRIAGPVKFVVSTLTPSSQLTGTKLPLMNRFVLSTFEKFKLSIFLFLKNTKPVC